MITIGLHHEVLVLVTQPVGGLVSSKNNAPLSSECFENDILSSVTDYIPNTLDGVESASAWAWSETIFSQFDASGDSEGKHIYQYCGIIIASPVALSSHNCGMSTTSADVVVSIDEDWSGREASHVSSILTKIRSRELS